jgi:hypothetical protein
MHDATTISVLAAVAPAPAPAPSVQTPAECRRSSTRPDARERLNIVASIVANAAFTTDGLEHICTRPYDVRARILNTIALVVDDPVTCAELSEGVGIQQLTRVHGALLRSVSEGDGRPSDADATPGITREYIDSIDEVDGCIGSHPDLADAPTPTPTPTPTPSKAGKRSKRAREEYKPIGEALLGEYYPPLKFGFQRPSSSRRFRISDTHDAIVTQGPMMRAFEVAELRTPRRSSSPLVCGLVLGHAKAQAQKAQQAKAEAKAQQDQAQQAQQAQTQQAQTQQAQQVQTQQAQAQVQTQTQTTNATTTTRATTTTTRNAQGTRANASAASTASARARHELERAQTESKKLRAEASAVSTRAKIKKTETDAYDHVLKQRNKHDQVSWTQSETEYLLSLVKQHGKKWLRISSVLGRSASSSRNRFQRTGRAKIGAPASPDTRASSDCAF